MAAPRNGIQAFSLRRVAGLPSGQKCPACRAGMTVLAGEWSQVPSGQLCTGSLVCMCSM